MPDEKQYTPTELAQELAQLNRYNKLHNLYRASVGIIAVAAVAVVTLAVVALVVTLHQGQQIEHLVNQNAAGSQAGLRIVEHFNQNIAAICKATKAACSK